MLTLAEGVNVYLATSPVDMRRGHDGLVAIARASWNLDVFAGHLFVFWGKSRDRCKVLFWSRGGFVVYYKRLERGRFQLPKLPAAAATLTLDATTLLMLLDGIDIEAVERPLLWKPKAPTSTPGAAQVTLTRGPARGSPMRVA